MRFLLSIVSFLALAVLAQTLFTGGYYVVFAAVLIMMAGNIFWAAAECMVWMAGREDK